MKTYSGTFPYPKQVQKLSAPLEPDAACLLTVLLLQNTPGLSIPLREALKKETYYLRRKYPPLFLAVSRCLESKEIAYLLQMGQTGLQVRLANKHLISKTCSALSQNSHENEKI